jgi:hypothetical protein
LATNETIQAKEGEGMKLTDKRKAALIIADHLSRSYTPLDGNLLDGRTRVWLIAQGYLESYDANRFLYRITPAGRIALYAEEEVK